MFDSQALSENQSWIFYKYFSRFDVPLNSESQSERDLFLKLFYGFRTTSKD